MASRCKGVKRILFTGGPCAGKTTVLAKLQQVLDNKGFRVFCVPEAATMLARGGVQLDTSKQSWDFKVQTQTSLLKMQTHLEDVFTEIAVNEYAARQKPSVILCDRGLFDGQAYVEPELWAQIIDEQGWAGLNFIEKRYDAIIHMVTAAQGAEEFYDLSNEARFETAEEARARDRALHEAYLGHSQFKMVDNESSDFQTKVNKSINMVSSILGLPTDVQVFKKYLVGSHINEDHSNIEFPDDIATERMTILETFLPVPATDEGFGHANASVCVRRREKNGFRINTYEKRFIAEGERIQEMRSISPKEYLEFLQNQDKSTIQLRKTRTCFVYKTQYFVLETYTNLDSKPTFLRVETNNENVELPSFVPIEKEVTSQASYSSWALAQRQRITF